MPCMVFVVLNTPHFQTLPLGLDKKWGEIVFKCWCSNREIFEDRPLDSARFYIHQMIWCTAASTRPWPEPI